MPEVINASAEIQLPMSPHKYADLLAKGAFKNELRQQLSAKGFYVVKGAILVERALEYRARAHGWLEGFKLGYDRNNEATWTNEHLPPHIKGGMFSSRVYHESWVWDVRSEPGAISAFAQLWGTDKLTTSFDGASIMLPHRRDLPAPSAADKWVAQGIVNLSYNGPEDGGLMVMQRSSLLIEEYFATFPEEKANGNSWGPEDWYGFTEEQQKWFYGRGCSWVKVCGEPGDLFLWDSRAIHYNRRPTGDRDRVCSYVCMAPDELLSDADRATKSHLFKTGGATTHNPFENIFVRLNSLEGPVQDPISNPSETVLKLSAVVPY